MTGPLLRTGSLAEFHPLGAVGNPVYLAAAQLRTAIRRNLGPEVANTFAIPQSNEEGDTIDWYAPAPGPVVPWSAATPDERRRAKAALLAIRERIEETARTLRAGEDTERQVFGRLLAQAVAVPSDEHVYLVDDRPVITFWGFAAKDTPAGRDALLDLDTGPAAADPPPPAPAAPERRRRSLWWWLLPLLLLLLLGALGIWYWLYGRDQPAPELVPERFPEQEPVEITEAPAAAPPDETEPPPEEAPVEPGSLRLDRDRIDIDDRATTGVGVEDATVEEIGPGLPDTLTEDEVLEGTATGDILDDIEAAGGDEVLADEVPPEESIDAEETEDPAAPEEEDAEGPGDEQAEEAPVPEESPEESPEGPGTPEEPPEPAPEDGTAPDEAPGEGPAGPEPPGAANQGQPRPEDAAAPGRQDPLAIPQDAVRAGSTGFLDGGWRSETSLQEQDTGQPIKLEYSFKDGTGEVRIRRSDNSVCKGGVRAQFKDGKLAIDNTSDIVCPDGTNFGRPAVECEVGGKNGAADCRGRYPSGGSFGMDIEKAP